MNLSLEQIDAENLPNFLGVKCADQEDDQLNVEEGPWVLEENLEEKM